MGRMSRRKPDLMSTIVASKKTTAGATADTPESCDARDLLLIVMSGNHVGEIHRLPRERALTIMGRDDAADVQILDAEVSRRHAAIRYDAKEDRFYIADLDSRNGSSLNGDGLGAEQRLTVGDKIGLGSITVLRLTSAVEPEAKYARKMYQAALRDGLTGAFNRRYLEERLESELAYARRHDTPVSLLLLDLDHFKKINDDHGHRAGDFVLSHFVRVIETAVRTEDVVARYGGEEFAVLCRDTDADQASILAERLRTVTQSRAFEHESQVIPVTVSIGIACARGPNAEPQALVESADRALYAAKHGGRNCCRVAGELSA
jgi:diguanylate cyclase (GGDEF)-like protein